MPNYFYTAKTALGETVKGTMLSEDVRQLALQLKNQEMMLVTAMSEDDKKNKRLNFFRLSSRVPEVQKIIMTKNLWAMMSAGLPLIRSFDVLAAQARNGRLKNVLSGIKERINKGESLSDAISVYPDVFSILFLSMVKAGEESGTLEETFKVLSLQMEKEHELKSKIQGAMIYPAIVLVAMLVLSIIVVTFVLPPLNNFFQTLKVELPIYTKIIMFAGNFALHNLLLTITTPLILFVLIYIALKTSWGKQSLDTLILKLPFFSALSKDNNCALFTRSLSSLESSGVSLVRSLEISQGIVKNFYFRQALSQAVEKVKKGEKLSETLKVHQKIFPIGVIEMLEVGEETGKTSQIFKKLAEFYEEESIALAGKMSTVIEPALIIVLGLAVGTFAVAVLGPMYSILGQIK